MNAKDSGFEDAVETVRTAYEIFVGTIMSHDFKHTTITLEQRQRMIEDCTKHFECMIEQNFFAYRDGVDMIYKIRTCDIRKAKFNFRSSFSFQQELENENPEIIKYFSQPALNNIYNLFDNFHHSSEYSDEKIKLLREFIIQCINGVNLIIGLYQVLTEIEEFQDELEFRLNDTSYKAVLSCMINMWWKLFTSNNEMPVEMINEMYQPTLAVARFVPIMYVDDSFTIYVNPCQMVFTSRNPLE